MNRKNKISTGTFLRSLILLVMMGWMGSAWAQDATTSEPLIYSTDFQEWDNIDYTSTVNKVVHLKTRYTKEDFTLTLNGVGVDPIGTDAKKFPGYTGYLKTAKYKSEYSKDFPTAITSKLKSITRIELIQVATGKQRGIMVSVKGDGDADWTPLHNVSIVKATGEKLSIEVKRTNCQIKFENFNDPKKGRDNNAYIVELKIYGNVSEAVTPKVLKQIRFNKSDDITGKFPIKLVCDDKDQAILPAGNTFSRPGYTFIGWTNGVRDYKAGDTYTATDAITQLEAKWEKNSYHLYDSNKAREVEWSFDPAKSPAINIFKANKQHDLSYTRPVNIYIDEKTQEIQDVALGINVKSGKVDNTSSIDIKGAQVKAGAKFTIPAIYGMKVAFNASVSIPEVTYQEDADTYTYTMAEDCNLYDITVTYPVLPDVVTENEIATDKYSFPNEKKELAGSATITLNNAHQNTGKRYKPGEIITLSAQPEYGYQIKEFRVKGSDTPLPMQESTDATTGETIKTATYTVTEGINTLQVVYEHLNLYQVQAQVNDYKSGSITLKPNYPQFAKEITKADENGRERVVGKECWYTEGTEVSVSVEGTEGYIVNSWTIDGTTKEQADNLYTFKVGKTATSIAVNLTEGLTGTVVFDYTSAKVNGKTEAYKNAESMPITTISNAKSFTIPTNYTFFKNIDDNSQPTEESWTLEYWVDQDNNHYELGHTYSFSKAKITLIPHFVRNPTSQNNRITNPTIRYDFGRKIHYYDDPDTKEQRKVCAQAVNIGSNKKPFWTSQVYVKTLQESIEHEYWRDVAMWCDTGKKGYIRNTDQEEWAAFGPGTTFWIAAGAGTKISMMTYSPITTTTIDGVVPTLDEARTQAERQKAGDNHRYVYAYTTQNSELRIPIVIGDDYSYYQWFELATLAANMMKLHVNVDNKQRGKITGISANSKYGAIKQEDGSYEIRQGDKAKINFERLFGYELDKIVDLKQTDDEGNPKAILQVNKDGTYTSTEGMTLKTTEPTAEEKAAGKRTRYEVKFSITDHRNLEICFKEKKTYYVTYNGDPNAMGSAPQADWVEAGDAFTIPENRTLYYEGYTLDHWEEEMRTDTQETTETPKHYLIGNIYTAEAKDLVLYPVFRINDFNIFDIDVATTATWHFAQKDGAPEILYQGVNGILVTQVENNEKKIDLKIDLVGNKDDLKNGKDGKFDNTNATANRENILINKESAINFPATPNCKVKLTATDKAPTSVTIAGKKQGDKGYTVGDKYIEVTSVQGASHTAVFSANVNAIDFSITYQKQIDTERTAIKWLTCNGVTLTAEQIAEQMNQNKYITFKNVDVWDSKNNREKVPELKGEATTGGTVSVTKKPTLTDRNTIITVTTTGGIVVATYPVKLVYQKPSVGLQFTGYKIGNQEYKNATSIAENAQQSGSIKLNFNHTMNKATIESNDKKTYESKTGTQLVFKYWDLTPGETYTFNIPANTLSDIYGTAYPSDLSLTLHIQTKASEYQHKRFDYVVKDGDIDAAITAANAKSGDDRFYIFVPDGEYHIGSKNENEKTDLLKSNISLIGQSQDGVTIWNQPKEEGLRTTATLHLDKKATNFYAQDLKLENRFDYWSAGSAGRAVAFHDQGNRTIMKNVSLISYQDTYFSNNAGADSRAYFEDCDIVGVVDFVCGDGNIWFEKCNLIHRDRSGNNIVAAEQGKIQEWGYVFNNCTIKTETENPQQHRDYNWTLARPWNDHPTCTFLNTTMVTLPKLTGWGKMDTGRIIRFHEYRSKDANGNLIPLTTRSLTACSPGAGSEKCVLSDVQAATYTKRNALGGSDGFEPDKLCKQIDAKSGIIIKDEELEEKETDDLNHTVWIDEIKTEDNDLKWNAIDEALCYFIFKLDEKENWKYIEHTTGNSFNLASYGKGFYCVRAANQRGGLGGATKAIEYVLADPYKLEIKKIEGYMEGKYGWSTICLPFNAKVPTGVIAYAATAHNMNDSTSLVTDLTMTLTPVMVINANKGYVVYGPVGEYYFHPTSNESMAATILKGNPKNEAIPVENNKGYVLSYKSTWGIGFYKFTGSTLAANRAWLPKEMVSQNNQDNLALGKHSIRFAIAPGATSIASPTLQKKDEKEVIYNLNGQQVDKASAQGGIFISSQKGKFYKASGSSGGRR